MKSNALNAAFLRTQSKILQVWSFHSYLHQGISLKGQLSLTPLTASWLPALSTCLWRRKTAFFHSTFPRHRQLSFEPFSVEMRLKIVALQALPFSPFRFPPKPRLKVNAIELATNKGFQLAVDCLYMLFFKALTYIEGSRIYRKSGVMVSTFVLITYQLNENNFWKVKEIQKHLKKPLFGGSQEQRKFFFDY